MAPKKTNKKTLVLLDVHAILHRAYHALPDFSSSSGEPTGALYGVSSMLMKIIDELNPDYIVAAYDLPKPTYRHIAYDNYKAGRSKTDENLILQIKRSRDIFKAFNIPSFEKEGFEADDILGTIVEQTKNNKDIEVIIASGDMDTLQLVSGTKVRVYTLRKGIRDTIIYDEKAVKERYGFGPKLLPDFKGLSGDQSDNIIGIAGIGEKTATKLITSFGSLEEIYKKLKKKPEDFSKKGIKDRIIGLLKEGEEEAIFSKMLGEIRRDVPINFSLSKESWRDGLDKTKVLDLFSELNFRTLSKRFSDLVGVEESKKDSVEKKEEKINQKELDETALALWIVDSNFTNPDIEDILQFTKAKNFKEAKEKIFKELKIRKLEKVYKEIELPLMPVIEKIEDRGIIIDTKKLSVLSKKLHKELSILKNKIWKESGEEFNLNSPKQLGEVLFDKMGLSPKNHKKTSSGARSTRESELEKLKDEYPIIENILKYRGLQKLLSTYIDNIPKMVSSDGRLHASFSQTGTTTGRMSSQNPNLQNIPIKSKWGMEIRKSFVSAKGFKLVSFDYSQIELRIAAFLSGDKKLLSVFKSGGDVHRAAASEVFGVPMEKVDEEMRRQAKVINFGILYGMGINALRSNLGTSRADAQHFYNEYFKKFSGLAKYMEKTKKEAGQNGYTTTYFGRRRYFEGIKSSIPFVRASAERMAINAPIQGTQADIIKLAMIKIDELLKKEGWSKKVYLLIQVHDELVYEIEEKLVDKVAPLFREIMENILPAKETGGLVFASNMSVGDNWGELK